MTVQQKERPSRKTLKRYNENNLSPKNFYLDKADRRCLMCGKTFISRGPHNRRCPKCNQKIDQAAENTFYMPTVYNNETNVTDFVPLAE